MTSTKIVSGAAALLLVTALVAPLPATAVPGNGRASVASSTASAAKSTRKASAAARRAAAQAAKRAALQSRIANVLANRARGFNAAASAIQRRIDAVKSLEAALAANIAPGTVVSFDGVDAELTAAQAALDAAKTAESDAAAMFKAVPDATTTASRRAAFVAAKAKARVARIGLVSARQHLRNAVLRLESIVNSLEAAAQ